MEGDVSNAYSPFNYLFYANFQIYVYKIIVYGSVSLEIVTRCYLSAQISFPMSR